MNKYIEILMNSNSMIDDQLNALTCLNQYKMDIEKIVNNVTVEIDDEINISNVNNVMNNIKNKLAKINFENLSDINKLAKIKAQIISCNKILLYNKPNIILMENNRSQDITNLIRNKFVIADLINTNPNKPNIKPVIKQELYDINNEETDNKLSNKNIGDLMAIDIDIMAIDDDIMASDDDMEDIMASDDDI